MRQHVTVDIPTAFIKLCKEMKMTPEFALQSYFDSINVAEVLLVPSYEYSLRQQQVLIQHTQLNRLASSAFSAMMKPRTAAESRSIISAQKPYSNLIGKIILINHLAVGGRGKLSQYNRLINIWHKKIVNSQT